MQTPPAQPEALHPIVSLEALAALSLAALIAVAIALIVGRLTRRLLRGIEGERYYTQAIASTTVKVLQRVTFALSLLVLAFPALDLAGVEIAVGLEPEQVTQWFTTAGARLLLLLLLGFAATRFAGSVIRRAEHEIADGPDYGADERRKRAKTLGATFQRFFSILIWSAAALMALRELDVDITPILTGAGIVGLAVGFGAQTLVKDIISGMFYLLDDAFRVGEYIISGSYKGTVESFSLRSIKLRHHRGYLYTVPFGELGAVQNMSRDWVIDKLSVSVTYDTDLDKVKRIIKQIGKELQADPELAPHIIETLKMQGVEQFGEFAIQIRLKMMTKPGEQFVIRRRAYAMINKAFAENGIEIALPTVTVAGGGEAAPAAAQRAIEMSRPPTAAE